MLFVFKLIFKLAVLFDSCDCQQIRAWRKIFRVVRWHSSHDFVATADVAKAQHLQRNSIEGDKGTGGILSEEVDPVNGDQLRTMGRSVAAAFTLAHDFGRGNESLNNRQLLVSGDWIADLPACLRFKENEDQNNPEGNDSALHK
ncbi:MAG: hypothetical protein HYX74_04695 [Acidobacteria bacterium]|nr:hypothetical protein [Acidobacteriota bacterium]